MQLVRICLNFKPWVPVTQVGCEFDVASLNYLFRPGGAVICGLFYMVGDAMRPAPLPKPQGSPQAPSQAPIRYPQGSHEGDELETWNSSELNQENDSGEWVITEPPTGEVLESEDLTWGSK